MRQVVAALRPYLARHRRLLLLAGLAMIGEVATALLMPWPLKWVFDSVLFAHDRSGNRLRHHLGGHGLLLLLLVSAASLAIAAADAAVSYADDRVTEIVAQRSIYDLRRDLFSHLQRLSVAFHTHADTRVGDLLARLSGDVQALQDLASSGISNLVTNGLTLVSMVLVMAVLDWRLAVLSAALTVPMAVVAHRTTLRMRVALRLARRQEGRVSAVLQESLSAIKLIQAYGRESAEETRLLAESDKSLAASLEAAVLQARLNPSITMLSTGATVGVTLYGVYLVTTGGITPGELLIFLGYLRGMQSPIRQLAKLSYQMGKAVAGVERIQESFAHEPEVREKAGATALRQVEGRVTFRGVTFGYRPGRPTLHDVTLEAAPGQTVALVGTTGAGKSTLLSLLPRFFDPWSGEVLVDGVDVREFTLASLRSRIALVLQDSLIFRASVRENIGFGRPGASNADIEAAAAAAGVSEVVARLEDGYETVVSERGATLSGGEKQCIGIARAILKDAPLVLLDEPTSALDSATEALVMKGLEALLADRTAFIIAHRLATVRNADLVAVMQSGRIVELGPPRDLLDRPSVFAELARAQSFGAPAPQRRRSSAPAKSLPATELEAALAEALGPPGP